MPAAPTKGKGLTSIRKSPACGTCRKKCRKCDRTRPVCNRCQEKGLQCEGYPPRFQFQQVLAPGQEAADEVDDDEAEVPSASSVTSITSTLTATALSEESTQKANFSPLSGTLSENRDSVSSQSVAAGYSPISDDTRRLYEPLLTHFEEEVSPCMTISVTGIENPLTRFALPLAYSHDGVLQALLGLSACHVCHSGKETGRRIFTTALQHRVAALHSLGSLLMREEVVGLNRFEEECVLAIVVLLVFHDICELGVTSHGAHLNGVAFICDRIAQSGEVSQAPDTSLAFFMTTLAWLDVLRGFSGAEKLTYSNAARSCAVDSWTPSFHTMIGCPKSVFSCISKVLEVAKLKAAGSITRVDFQDALRNADGFLREWSPDNYEYPTEDKEWVLLGSAFRHACLLRVMRWPDTFSVSCEDPKIQASVSAILDICAKIPKESPFYKRLMFPLFLAAADTTSAHQIHYADLCLDYIKYSTGFPSQGMTEILNKVWEERRANTQGWVNVPWMEYTCSSHLDGPQHAYLFF